MVNLCIVGDRLTVRGLELAGLKNMYVADENNVAGVMKDFGGDMDVILITQSLARYSLKEIDSLRKQDKIIVEIPDREGGGEETISKVVRDVVGFDLVE